MKAYILSALIFIILLASIIAGIWFLIKPDQSAQELAFLKQEGFLDESGKPLKSPGLTEQNINASDESFEVLATKLDKNNGSYQLAFKLENRSNQKKEFYLIPVSEKDQLEFQEIKGVINNTNILAINKDDVSKQPLETLYDIQKHKKELNPELAKAYDDMEGNNYKGDPIKIILAPNSSLIAKSQWQIRLGRTSTDLEPVYFLVYGSAGGAKEELTILNVHSSPQQGENWEVEFTTIGTADLKIIPQDQATIDDDEFVGLYCNGEERIPQILPGDIIYYPNWQCLPSEALAQEGDGIGKVVHYTKTAGNHTLRFEFGDQVAYAYNAHPTKQFIIGGTSDDPINNNTTEYSALMGNGEILWNATEASVEEVIPTAGTLSNFQVSVRTAPNTGNSWTFTIRKTNGDTALSVSIAEAATLSSVDADEVTVAAGDKVAISATGTGTPTAAARVRWTVQFTPTIEGETILMSNTAGVNLAVNSYDTLIGGKGAEATEFDAQTLFPTAGILKKLYVELGTAPGGANSRTFTIRLNGSDQALATTISGTSTTNSDTTNTVTVAAGDNIAIKNAIVFSPAASIAKFGLVFAPDTVGQWFTSATTDDPLAGANGTEYQHLTAGDSTLSATETEFYGLAQATTAKAIYVETSADAGNGEDLYTFRLRRNGTTDTNLTCGITASTTACTYAEDIAISANDLLSTSIVGSSAPAGTPASQVAYLFYNLPVNAVPAVSSVADGPDAIQVGQTITFSTAWSDADADGVKMLICKTNAVTAAASPTCTVAEWCSDKDVYHATTPLSCTYQIQSGDVGVQNYYAFVCDDWPSCNASGTAGTFTAKTNGSPALKFEGGIKFEGGTRIGDTLSAWSYTADSPWTKIADTLVRDIAGDYNATIAKDIYCDNNNCVLYTDGQAPPTTIDIVSDSNVYANLLWSKTDSALATWGPAVSISGGDIGGTHGNINVGNDPDNVNAKNWLARNYTSASGIYPAMDTCKAKGSGWRLPNILEIDSIRDQSNGAAPYSDLPNIVSTYYWSSTESSSTGAYYLYFGTGSVYNLNKTSSRYVRCVKGQ